MKGKGFFIILTLLFTTMLFSPPSRIVFAEEKAVSASEDHHATFEGSLELTFFNKAGNSPLGQTFRRYHLLTLSYEKAPLTFGAAYNWWDSVEGATSVHDLTPWMLKVQYLPSDAWKATVEYWYVRNLLGLGDSQTFSVAIEKKWRVTPHGEGTLVIRTSAHYPLKIGGEFSFGMGAARLMVGWNMLPTLDEHYVDSRNPSFSAGISIPFSSGVELRVVGYNLVRLDAHPTRWVRSTLQMRLW